MKILFVMPKVGAWATHGKDVEVLSGKALVISRGRGGINSVLVVEK